MIGFESSDVQLKKLRERLQAMSDEELIKFGKYARGLCGLRVSGTGDPFKVQLDEARGMATEPSARVNLDRRAKKYR